MTTPLSKKIALWLSDVALPQWADVGVDDYSFVEHLDLNGVPANVAYKRLRVQARQIYVFSHAYLQGWTEGLAVARQGYEFITFHGWMPGGGWARKLGREGGVIDGQIDLYDQAFALFALAWYYKATGDAQVLTYALETLVAIKRQLAVEGVPGYRSASDADDSRAQNPHMHLFEACLAWREFSGEAAFSDEADALFALFADKLFDPLTGTLAEFYDASWNRASGERGMIIEPGHHLEWVWLLAWYARSSGVSTATYMKALFDFAETHGIDAATGLTLDEVLSDGSIRSASRRLWPQTEALKAHLAMRSLGVAGRVEQIGTNILNVYLAPAPAGTWIDHFDAHGDPIVDKIPTSSFYHLFLAFSELLTAEDMKLA